MVQLCNEILSNEMRYECTQWTMTQPLKRGNNAICSNMDGPRDCHIE